MEANATYQQVVEELESVRRELREVKEQYALAVAENQEDVESNPSQHDQGNSTPILETPTEHPHIFTSPEMHGGEPTIRGSGIMVRSIIERTRLGQTPEEICSSLPILSLAKIYDALSFYYDHTAEIEQYIRENEEAEWRLMHRVSS